MSRDRLHIVAYPWIFSTVVRNVMITENQTGGCAQKQQLEELHYPFWCRSTVLSFIAAKAATESDYARLPLTDLRGTDCLHKSEPAVCCWWCTPSGIGCCAFSLTKIGFDIRVTRHVPRDTVDPVVTEGVFGLWPEQFGYRRCLAWVNNASWIRKDITNIGLTCL